MVLLLRVDDFFLLGVHCFAASVCLKWRVTPPADPPGTTTSTSACMGAGLMVSRRLALQRSSRDTTFSADTSCRL